MQERMCTHASALHVARVTQKMRSSRLLTTNTTTNITSTSTIRPTPIFYRTRVLAYWNNMTDPAGRVRQPPRTHQPVQHTTQASQPEEACMWACACACWVNQPACSSADYKDHGSSCLQGLCRNRHATHHQPLANGSPPSSASVLHTEQKTQRATTPSRLRLAVLPVDASAIMCRQLLLLLLTCWLAASRHSQHATFTECMNSQYFSACQSQLSLVQGHIRSYCPSRQWYPGLLRSCRGCT